MRTALFPGQGSQYVGMGRDLHARHPRAQELYARAETILGFALTRVCFEGPEAELTRTSRAQPAIYVHSCVAWTLWGDARGHFDFAAGHSLGEFSALTAAGAWDFETGLRLVTVRSGAMQRACDECPGTMAALTQLPPDRLEPLLDAARSAGIIEAANFNADGQVVVSGERTAIEQAVRIAPEFGARRALILKVGGAFHSPLMAGAGAELAAALDAADIRSPACPVVLNVTARPSRDPAEIRARLKEQLTSPVRWLQSMRFLAEVGVRECVEVGPGRVLQGLARRALGGAALTGLDTVTDLESVGVTETVSS